MRKEAAILRDKEHSTSGPASGRVVDVAVRDIEDAQRRILLDCLEARLVACEVWRASLNFHLESPRLSEWERARAIRDREAAIIEWGEVMTTLEEVRSGDFDNHDASC